MRNVDDYAEFCLIPVVFEHLLKLLIKNKAKVNQADKSQITPLIQASLRGYDKVVRQLLDAGADVDHQNVRGETALYVAAIKQQFETAKLLINAGADFDKALNDGETPRMRFSNRKDWYPEEFKELETLALKKMEEL